MAGNLDGIKKYQFMPFTNAWFAYTNAVVTTHTPKTDMPVLGSQEDEKEK